MSVTLSGMKAEFRSVFSKAYGAINSKESPISNEVIGQLAKAYCPMNSMPSPKVTDARLSQSMNAPPPI